MYYCCLYLVIIKDLSNVKENFVISPLVVHSQELKWPRNNLCQTLLEPNIM